MKRISKLLTLCLCFSSFNAYAFQLFPDNAPIEFLQSLTIGKQDIQLKIPSEYQIVNHDIIDQEQILGFIPDGQSIGGWQQYISITIAANTSESAGQKIRNIQKYIKREYAESEILSSDINRQSSGVENAETTIRFTDEESEVVLRVVYYSDSSKLVGTQVSQRVGQSFKLAKRAAEKTASRVIKLR